MNLILFKNAISYLVYAKYEACNLAAKSKAIND
jgi:hypothetical protein